MVCSKDMNYDFKSMERHIEEVRERLHQELLGLRTGRATPVLIENVVVEYHDTKVLLKQLAAIQIEDARTLRVQPWDPASVLPIEKALRGSEIGAQPVVDKETIRIILPELTQERREQLTKLVHKKLEDAHVALRRQRDTAWHDIQGKERAKELTEDDKYRLKDQLERMVNEGNKSLEAIAEKKEKELKF